VIVRIGGVLLGVGSPVAVPVETRLAGVRCAVRQKL